MVKHVLKRHEIETGNDFYKVVASNDVNKSGFITKIAFVYTMSKVYQLSKEQIESLLGLLEEEKGVNIGRLEEVLNNPTTAYFAFCAAEEESEKKKPVAPVSSTSSTFTRFRY